MRQIAFALMVALATMAFPTASFAATTITWTGTVASASGSSFGAGAAGNSFTAVFTFSNLPTSTYYNEVPDSSLFLISGGLDLRQSNGLSTTSPLTATLKIGSITKNLLNGTSALIVRNDQLVGNSLDGIHTQVSSGSTFIRIEALSSANLNFVQNTSSPFGDAGLFDLTTLSSGITGSARFQYFSNGSLRDDNLILTPTRIEISGLLAPAAAVPEPATWAMFILGLGLIGFSMRRRNAATARSLLA